jgi:hypothetical protein
VVREQVSDEQRAFRIDGRLGSVVLDSALPFVAEKVEPQAVVIEVSELEQVSSEANPLVVLEEALEDGVLHPLAVVKAGIGHTAEPALAVGRDGGDIVADEDHHGRGAADLPPFEWRVGIEIAAEMTGQEQGLGVEEQADGDIFAEEGVVDFLLFAFLPGCEHFLAAVVGEQDRAGFQRAEMLGADLLAIDEREGEAVGVRSAKLLHEVQGEAVAAGAVAVEESNGGIESVRREGTGGVEA